MVEELLKTTFLGIALKNPLVVASGVLGTSASLMERASREGCGNQQERRTHRAQRACQPGHAGVGQQRH